jgi:hypothetical protein
VKLFVSIWEKITLQYGHPIILKKMIQNVCVASPGMEGTCMSPKLTNNGLGSLDEYGGGGEDGSR